MKKFNYVVINEAKELSKEKADKWSNLILEAIEENYIDYPVLQAYFKEEYKIVLKDNEADVCINDEKVTFSSELLNDNYAGIINMKLKLPTLNKAIGEAQFDMFGH